MRLDNRKILEAANTSEITALEPRLQLKDGGFQTIVDEVARADVRAKKINLNELIDSRILDENGNSKFLPGSGEMRRVRDTDHCYDHDCQDRR